VMVTRELGYFALADFTVLVEARCSSGRPIRRTHSLLDFLWSRE